MLQWGGNFPTGAKQGARPNKKQVKMKEKKNTCIKGKSIN